MDLKANFLDHEDDPRGRIASQEPNVTKTTENGSRSQAMAAWSDYGSASDNYYKTVTNWLTSTRRHGPTPDLSGLATIYEKSLHEYIRCIENLPKTSEIERSMTQAQMYLSLLQSDMEFLLPMCERTPEARRS